MAAVCLWLLVLLGPMWPVSASLNLYLTQAEVHRLLGLSAELFYVREGVINEYALNFVVPVPAHIEQLSFTWQSLGAPLPYSLSVEASDPVALPKPSINVSARGTVPNQAQTWVVNLACSGLVSAEVDVVIRVNVTILSTTTLNTTTLRFRRRKICRKEERSAVGAAPGVSSGATDPQLTAVSPPALPMASVFYIAVGSACLLIALIGGLAAYATHLARGRKRLQRDQDSSASEAAGGPLNGSLAGSHLGSHLGSGGYHAPSLPPSLAPSLGLGQPNNSLSCKSYASFRRLPYSPLEPRLEPEERARHEDLQQRIAQLTIQRCRVRLRAVLLEGTFGRVYRGSYQQEDGAEQDVLVKTVTDHASQVQVSLLLQEGMMLYGLSHPSVLSVLGVSLEDHTAPFLLYSLRSNLKRFLQQCKLSAEGVAHTLTTQEVVDMALQVASAMQYLHRKRLLHRDLAARNCVVDDKLRVQITDNALSRDLFPADYQCLGDNENRPVKWLAIESLTHKSFSTASDVWSFGVLLWELTTLAQQPYVEIDPFEMAAYLRDGYRLAQPVNCPDELFAVMAYCWAMSSEDRPTFPQLNICLQEFYTQLTRYV